MRKTLAALGIAIALIAAPTQAEDRHSCAECGQAIAGPYFQTKGRYYHPEHFTCGHCAQPIKSAYSTYRGENYHNSCFRDHVALRCTVCDGIVSGQYILDYWGNAYHSEHQNEVPTCDFCSRFATNDLFDTGIMFKDGRFLCGICRPSAVENVGDAHALVEDVAARLRRFGMDTDVSSIRLHLVSRERMQRVTENRSHGLRGFTDYKEEKNLFGRVVNREVCVYLLYGMPRIEMMATIAHELAHVWTFSQGRVKHDPALAEGSCNFASYLVLRNIGGDEAEYTIYMLENDEDEVYGEGFRRVRHYADENGLAGWLKLLKKRNPRLP